ncbi:MAG: AAA family ATPase [Pseudomonadota bacterium]
MKFTQFRVTNFRNIHDSGSIRVNNITAIVGQNEAGKSNLFEALYRINPFDGNATYNIDEDWPVDRWDEKDEKAIVCQANFELDEHEIESLFDAARKASEDSEEEPALEELPSTFTLQGTGYYYVEPHFWPRGEQSDQLDQIKVNAWAKQNVPKFVYIRDYEMSGSQMELNDLQRRRNQVSWDELTADEQTILTVLELANVELDDFIEKGSTPEGRTIRSFDKRSASSFLSQQFQKLWTQKKVRFEIEIDATTLNIFAEDDVVGMPVRLNRRSTGFRWYVAFAWKFTHASDGQFSNCTLLLEEPGIHLHYTAQRDLLKVFERLKTSNTILYTTHLASMVDLGYPERIRMVENLEGSSATVREGVVSKQKGPMAVIEMSLGLTGSMSGLLGNRKTLVVEGGDEALILNKISGLLRSAERQHLSDSIYIWASEGASKTPMYAAFAIGQQWQSGVLLDTDEAGHQAKKKIDELYLSKLAEKDEKCFRVLMLGAAAGIKKTDAAIEDLFPDSFYLDLVNEAYGYSIKLDELPVDGSDMITKRVESVLKSKHGLSGLDKGRVVGKMLQKFDEWTEPKHLPAGTLARAEKLFKTINSAFGAVN